MNKKRILILVLIFLISTCFVISSVSSVSGAKGYMKYKGSINKLALYNSESPNVYMPGDGYYFKKEFRYGKNNRYSAGSEIAMFKKGKKTKKIATLRIGSDYNRVNSNFKAVVKFRYWNGYKYTNYKTKSYIKKSGLANINTHANNWIPYSIKIYTK